MLLVWVLLAPARADDAAVNARATPWADTDVWRSGAREPIPGIVGIESQLEKTGGNMADVLVMSADYGFRTVGPELDSQRSVWDRFLGANRLTVRTSRISDGVILAEASKEQSVDAPEFDPEKFALCATLDVSDSRPVSLFTWDENSGIRPTSESSEQAYGTSLFFLTDAGSRELMTYLNPGDSITVIEVLDDVGSRPRRRIEVRRSDAWLVVKERPDAQRVCLNPRVQP
jgi:hypothetical protein